MFNLPATVITLRTFDRMYGKFLICIEVLSMGALYETVAP